MSGSLGASTRGSIAEDLLGIRRDVFFAAEARGAGHVASALSLVETLYCLYFRGWLRFDPERPDWEERDRLVLSKGHGSLALYSVLSRVGFFPHDELLTFAQPDSRLGGEPNRLGCPGVEASTGSLGHGLSIGLGLSLGFKMDGSGSRTFVIVGDGECQEGSVWEAASVAPRLGLGNLVVIVDDNAIQKEVPTEDVVGEDRLLAKWKAFGWATFEADGHSVDSLDKALEEALGSGTPSAIIAHTVKGKGLGVMEGRPEWHYRMPRKKERTSVLEDLGMGVG